MISVLFQMFKRLGYKGYRSYTLILQQLDHGYFSGYSRNLTELQTASKNGAVLKICNLRPKTCNSEWDDDGRRRPNFLSQVTGQWSGYANLVPHASIVPTPLDVAWMSVRRPYGIAKSPLAINFAPYIIVV